MHPNISSTADIDLKAADPLGENSDITTPANSTEEPAVKADTDAEKTVTKEQPVGDLVFNEDVDDKSEGHTSDAEGEDMMEEGNEGGLDLGETSGGGVYSAQPASNLSEGQGDPGDRSDLASHEPYEVTGVAVDQGRFWCTCVLSACWKPHPSPRVYLLLFTVLQPNLPA